MRDKWDELRGETTYGQLTIEKACENRQDKTKTEERPQEEQPQVGGEFRVRRLSDVATRPVRWWWYPYLPFGHLCSLEGDGGTGKSTLAALLGARMTRGEHPHTGAALMAPRTVLILSSEEAVEEMLSPKMDAYGADRDLVIVADIPRWDEKDQWRFIMGEFRPGLVIVDPLQEFFGGRTNPNMANQVREALTPLGDLMAEFDCIGLCIQHFGKSANERKSIHKALGSADIGARMRSILQVEEVGEGRYLLTHAKHNLGPAGEDIAYTLEPCQISEGVIVPQVVWVDPVEGRTDREAAKAVIRRTLRDGEKTTKEMRQVREEHGFSESTWERALRELGLTAMRGRYPQLE
jgi:RecA-family ATPase